MPSRVRASRRSGRIWRSCRSAAARGLGDRDGDGSGTIRARGSASGRRPGTKSLRSPAFSQAQKFGAQIAIPLQVTGAQSFLLFAVWAQKDPAYPYVRAVIRAVELYRDLIAAQPTVMLGDFNSNSFWDRTGEEARDHSYLVRLLAELGAPRGMSVLPVAG